MKTLIEEHNLEEFKRALKILHSTRLQHLVRIKDVIQEVKRYISFVKLWEIMFYFDYKESWKELVRELAALERKESDNMAVEIVQKYHADPEEFPSLLMNIARRGLLYNVRTYPLYVCEAKFLFDRKYMCQIILILV